MWHRPARRRAVLREVRAHPRRATARPGTRRRRTPGGAIGRARRGRTARTAPPARLGARARRGCGRARRGRGVAVGRRRRCKRRSACAEHDALERDDAAAPIAHEHDAAADPHGTGRHAGSGPRHAHRWALAVRGQRLEHGARRARHRCVHRGPQRAPARRLLHVRAGGQGRPGGGRPGPAGVRAAGRHPGRAATTRRLQPRFGRERGPAC